jgi:hypothetical protein
MGRSLLALVSDLHTNSTLGLCSPEATLPEGQSVSLTKAQTWLWQGWQDWLGRVKDAWRPGDKLYGVAVGDGPDLNKKTTQLHTHDPGGAITLFVETIRPLRELCEDGFWIVRGTENHVGDAGNLEEVAAMLLQTTHYPADSKLASAWLLRLALNGVRVDLAHHGPAGRLPWTGPNGLGRVAYEIIDEYVRAGEALPHLAVQAHNHKFYDTHDNFPIRVLGLPCWQLQTSYGYRVSPRRATDIGAVLVILEDGRMQVEPTLFRAKMEARWVAG